MCADTRRLDPEDRVPLLESERKESGTTAGDTDPENQWHEDLNRELAGLFVDPPTASAPTGPAPRLPTSAPNPVSEAAQAPVVAQALSGPGLVQPSEVDDGDEDEPLPEAVRRPRLVPVMRGGPPASPIVAEDHAGKDAGAARSPIGRDEALEAMSRELRDRLRRRYAAEYEREIDEGRAPVLHRMSTALTSIAAWPRGWNRQPICESATAVPEARIVIRMPVAAAKRGISRAFRSTVSMPRSAWKVVQGSAQRVLDRTLEFIGDFLMPMPETFDWRGLRRAFAALGLMVFVLVSSMLTVMLLRHPDDHRSRRGPGSTLPSKQLSVAIPLMPSWSGVAHERTAAAPDPVQSTPIANAVGADAMLAVAEAVPDADSRPGDADEPAPVPSEVPVVDVRAPTATPVAAIGTSVETRDFVYTADDRDVRPPVVRSRQARGDQAQGVTADEIIELELIVAETGAVDSVKLTTDLPRMDLAMMLSAVKNWRFDPAVRDGRPVKYRLQLRVPRMR